MNQRQVLAEQFVAPNRLDAGVERLREFRRGALERGGAEDVGRRVDEVAPERDRGRDALDVFTIDPGGRSEAGLRRGVGLEAVEAIEPEQEAERREFGVLRGIGEAPVAGGQRGREFARGERVAIACVRAGLAEQRAREAAARVGQQLEAARFGLEAAGGRESRGSSPIALRTSSQFSGLTNQIGTASVASGVNRAAKSGSSWSDESAPYINIDYPNRHALGDGAK